MSDRFGDPISRHAIISSVLNQIASISRANETILKEVIQNDDQVSEQLINALLTDCLPSRLRCIPSVTQQE